MSSRAIKVNPVNMEAPWSFIKSKRDEIELSPITLDDGRTFDFDNNAMKRMTRSLKRFDNLTTLTPEGKLGWKLENDDTTFLSKTELSQVLEELETKQAIRSGIVHYQAQIFKAGSHTIGFIEDLNNWGVT